jgi:long-chain acyl-CoA synthetase
LDHLYDLFASAAARFPDRTAVEVQRASAVDTYRYDTLRAMALNVASRLASRGCGKGDRVAILAENDAHWCAAFLGILRLGAVAVPLDTAYKPRQVATVLADSGAGILLASRRHLGEASEALAGVTGGIPLLIVDEVTADGDAGDEALLPVASVGRGDPAVILYTSGTTSDPKGVVLTHGNLLAEREAAFQIVRIDETDGVLSVLPLFHALALLANLLLPFSAGARVVFLETVNTSELMRALAERDISTFCCVPQFFYLIHERVMREVAASGAAKRFLFRALLAGNGWLRSTFAINLGKLFFRPIHTALGPRMRILVTGASRFDPAVGRDLVRLGFDIQQAYGLTECSGAATLTRPGDLRIGHVGPPLPGVEVKIAPASAGEEVAGDGRRDGEILIRGPIVMPGYYHRPDANAATLKDGWLHTGDLGFIDAKGRVHVTGRSKEVIVLASGKNIHPEEIEAHYARSPFVRELCVLGRARPGEPAAERLHAVVVPDLDVMRERKIVNMLEQIRFEIEGLSVELPSHKRIQSYDIRLEDLPRTTTRKLKRFALERELDAAVGGTKVPPPSAEGAGDSEWLEDPFAARAVALVREAAKPGTSVHAAANLELDLGFDSMERVELVVRLEQAAGVRIPDEAAHRIYTVRDLVEALRAAPQGEAGAVTARDSMAWDRLLAEAQADEPALAALLRRRTLATIGLFLLARAFRLAARLTIGFRASGLERLPTTGPFILSPNHQSYLDAFLLVAVLPYRVFRKMFFVGASEYFATPLRRRIARAIHVVPVDPDTNLVQAMQAGAFGLRNGKVLILFPEGERSIDGGIKKFKKGAAILSLHLSVPIVPVAMDGAFDVWPRSRPFGWRALIPANGGRVLLEVGEPISPAPGETSSAAVDTEYAALTERLRAAVERSWLLLRGRRVSA